MKILGLTGPSGSGKGALEAFFAKHGIPFLDTDAVYHDITSKKSSPCLLELQAAFGDFILDKNGALDRPALAAYVFDETADKASRLARLNDITHKYVLKEARAWLDEQEKKGYKAAIIDAPLLYESAFDRECDYVIAVLAPRETRIARIMLRDSITLKAAEARVNAQKDDDFYKSHADFVIVNDSSVERLDEEAKSVIARLNL